MFGGEIRYILTGSAPISGEIMNFLRIAFITRIAEGYGQTESTGGLTVTRINDDCFGHVGGPLPNIEIKLIDVPEMNYKTNNDPPRGELVA